MPGMGVNYQDGFGIQSIKVGFIILKITFNIWNNKFFNFLNYFIIEKFYQKIY